MTSRRGTAKASLVLSTGSPRPLRASAELDHAKYVPKDPLPLAMSQARTSALAVLRTAAGREPRSGLNATRLSRCGARRVVAHRPSPWRRATCATARLAMAGSPRRYNRARNRGSRRKNAGATTCANMSSNWPSHKEDRASGVVAGQVTLQLVANAQDDAQRTRPARTCITVWSSGSANPRTPIAESARVKKQGAASAHRFLAGVPAFAVPAFAVPDRRS